MQKPDIRWRQCSLADPERSCPCRAQGGEREEQQYVDCSLGYDLDCLENGESERLVLLSESCEQDGGYAVESQDAASIHYAVLEPAVSEPRCNRTCECNDKSQKCSVYPEYSAERIGIHGLRSDSLPVGETEAAGLETEYKDDLEHGYVSHEFRDYAIAFRCQAARVDRDEQEVDYPCQDGAQPINGSLSCQLFQRISHNARKNIP